MCVCVCVQVLRDTSYQRKYNVRPVQLDELDAGLVHVKSEPAAEEVQGDSLQHLSEAAAPGLPCQSGELSERFEPVLSLLSWMLKAPMVPVAKVRTENAVGRPTQI